MKVSYYKNWLLNAKFNGVSLLNVYKKYSLMLYNDYKLKKNYVNIDNSTGEILQKKDLITSIDLFQEDLLELKTKKIDFNKFRKFVDNHPRIVYNLMLLIKSYSKRYTRLYKFIGNMFSKPCLFITLTFSNKILNSTNKKTRREYVNRWLRNFNTYSVSNIDYGKKNGREHYHCLIQVEKINYKSWSFGRINGLKVRVVKNRDNESNKKLAHYIMKLTKHSIKSTTKNERLIYKIPKTKRILVDSSKQLNKFNEILQKEKILKRGFL